MDMATRLELFIDIVQHGTFAKVADIHNLDRSVVSKQIKALETQLGIRLLNRSTRALALTDAGAEVLKQAEIVRNALVDTEKLAQSFHCEPKGLLRITSNVSFGHLYLRPAINRFMAKYPDTYIDLMLDDKRTDIIGDKFDIAFRIGPPKDSNLIAKKLASNKLAILASHSFIQQYGKPATIEALIALPAVIYFNGEFHLNKIEISESPSATSSRMVKYNQNGRFRANDVGSLLSAVEAGLGYSVISLTTLEQSIEKNGLVPLLTDYKLANNSGGIYAVYPHRNQTPLVNKFIEMVIDVIGTPPIWEGYINDYESFYQ
ncbi:LysR family transcriptional regulator [Shewanella goraebulensis]|uniref:LysR family transcriptional regulator n=1 Tax=Shewanella goraebulensis TaxID=3050637 RepID=UPI0025504948|nr:LysR family transcriptional regulator [Shewanella goraebulensis]